MLCAGRVRWFPSSQPPLFAAPRYQAASAQPSCRSGVILKRTLQTFIQTCLKLNSSRQTQGVMGRGFYRRRELWVRCAASALRSSAETQLRWNGFISTQHLASKAGLHVRGKSQLFHTTDSAEFVRLPGLIQQTKAELQRLFLHLGTNKCLILSCAKEVIVASFIIMCKKPKAKIKEPGSVNW